MKNLTSLRLTWFQEMGWAFVALEVRQIYLNGPQLYIYKTKNKKESYYPVSLVFLSCISI